MVSHRRKIIFASAVLALILTYWIGTLMARDTTETTQLHRMQTEVGSLAHRMGGDVTTRHVTEGKASLTLKLHPDIEDDLASFIQAHAETADIKTGPMTPGSDGYRRMFIDMTIRGEWRDSMALRWPIHPVALPFYFGMSAALGFLLYMISTLIMYIAEESIDERRLSPKQRPPKDWKDSKPQGGNLP